MDDVLLLIKDVEHVINAKHPSIIVVKETDEISIAIKATTGAEVPSFQIEDYVAKSEIVERANGKYHQIPSSTYFSECFGGAVVRIRTNEEEEEILLTFDVLAKKTSAEQAQKMIQYLADRSTSFVKACLSRTAIPIGSTPGEEAEPEAILASAEGILATFQNYRSELMTHYRERLVPTRLPLRSTSKLTCEIDPMEVISNLDALTLSTGIGEVALRGRYFDIGDIEVSALQPTADVYENHVLIGGLYSIRRRILSLQQLLLQLPTSQDGTPVGYESFSRLLLTITAGGMIGRCESALNSVEILIDLFKGKLGVSYQGELPPTMTPFVRSTRVYRALYSQFADWYSIGAPALGGTKFMLKMKSLSKIYEIFTLHHLLEELLRCGWELTAATPHPEFGEYLPSSISFRNELETLRVEYEPRINRKNDSTKDQDLIDVYHSSNSKNPYRTPDFVLRLDAEGSVRYMILDAKYSRASAVMEYHIPDLYEKYYEGMAVYNSAKQILTNTQITAVVAIYALEWGHGSYITKSRTHQGIFSKTPRVPIVGGVGLMTENDTLFNQSIAKILEITRLSVGL